MQGNLETLLLDSVFRHNLTPLHLDDTLIHVLFLSNDLSAGFFQHLQNVSIFCLNVFAAD